MKHTAKILIADDHPLLLKGLEDFIKELGYQVIASVSDGNLAYTTIVKEQPEIAILDIEMPKLSGIEIARLCKANKLTVKIVLITMHKQLNLYQEASKLNIFGYLLKDYALDEIEHCIKSVLNNTPYFAEKISRYFKPLDLQDDFFKKFTTTEKRILKLIANYKTTKEIAHLLFISELTVTKHRTNISRKLNLEGKTNSLLNWVQKNKQLFEV